MRGGPGGWHQSHAAHAHQGQCWRGESAEHHAAHSAPPAHEPLASTRVALSLSDMVMMEAAGWGGGEGGGEVGERPPSGGAGGETVLLAAFGSPPLKNVTRKRANPKWDTSSRRFYVVAAFDRAAAAHL